MTKIEKLRAEREKIVQEIAGLEQMRRGSIIEQYVETVRKDGSKGRRGPYFLYTYKDKGKTVSRRVTQRSQVDAYREQIKSFRRFQKLVPELRAVSEKIGDLALRDEAEVKKTKSSESKKKLK